MSIVFHAPKPPTTIHPKSWAPLEHIVEDDELVYPVPNVRKGLSPIPNLRFLHAVPGKKSLRFEALLRSVFCVALADSGATHSFVSQNFCDRHGLKFSFVTSHALLADGQTSLPVVGVMWNATLKIHRFSCKQSFLVLKCIEADVVLGMDWLAEHDPCISFRKRCMKLSTPGGIITVPAVDTTTPYECESSCIELCTLDAFTRSLRSDASVRASHFHCCKWPWGATT
jgi:hypothetical protein